MRAERDQYRNRTYACEGRQAYLTWTAADKAMNKHRMRARRGQGHVEPKKCRFCQQWHLDTK